MSSPGNFWVQIPLGISGANSRSQREFIQNSRSQREFTNSRWRQREFTNSRSGAGILNGRELCINSSWKNLLKIRLFCREFAHKSPYPSWIWKYPRELENFPRASPSGNFRIPSDILKFPPGCGNLCANSLQKTEFLTQIIRGYKKMNG